MDKKRIAILGSTGSIGTQALEVAQEQAHCTEIQVLTAQNNADLLIKQALEHRPKQVVIVNEKHFGKVKDALAGKGVEVLAGKEALCNVVQSDDIDMVLTALVGYSGLKPTIKAIEAKKHIALANVPYTQ